jgi:PCO_ADO
MLTQLLSVSTAVGRKLYLQGFHSPAPELKQELLVLRKRLNDITTNDFKHLDIRANPCQVSATNIHSNEFCSISLFCFGKDSTIPLHDHPNMIVFSKILQGYAQIVSLSPQASPNPLSLSGSSLKSVYRCTENQVYSASSVIINDRSLHAIKQVGDQNLVMLDVLVPPYDFKNRDCRYYNCSNDVWGLQRDTENVELVCVGIDHPSLNLV